MAMNAREIEALIKTALPDAKVVIRDLAGDGDHYAAEVVSESFRGKNRVQQHQMVYKALQGKHGRRASCAGAPDQRAAEAEKPESYESMESMMSESGLDRQRGEVERRARCS